MTSSAVRNMQSFASVQSLCSLKRKRPPKIQIPDVLKEIKTDTQFGFGVSPAKDDVVSSFGGVGVGFSSVKGKKKFMEDTHKIVSSINGDSKKGFFGVYDGHGGRKAAEFVAESLHNNVIDMLANREESMAKEEAVKAAYLRTDKEFLEQDVGSGTCCVTVLIEGNEMIVSNLGDCRAVLCRGGAAEALTKDHKPGRVDERKRIEDKGGYVEFHKGAWRVHGILAVSRSIGDAHLKDWVVAEPDTKIIALNSDMDFVVLASDGLWEQVGNQEVIDTVLKFHAFEKKPGSPTDGLLLDNHNQRQRNLLKENNDEEYHHCVNTSSSPKVKRVSLAKPKKIISTISPIFRENLNDFDTENESTSPPAKMRRISLFQHKNVVKIQSPIQENKQPVWRGLVAACKELVNLAISRGSLDDITVIVVDLNHFKGSRM